MFNTLLQDREKIENKFHKQSEPYNSFNRMGYHGYDFDSTTGLEDEQLLEGIVNFTKENKSSPLPIFKAKLFAYILQNTKIDVNESDYFVGIWSLNRDRLVAPFLFQNLSQKLISTFPKETKLKDKYAVSGICYGNLDYDHTVPDWDSLCRLGFIGILKRAEKSYEKLRKNGKITQRQSIFFEAIKIEYQAILALLDRLYQYALTKTHAKAQKVAECLKHLRDGAPTNTYEVLQMIYIYFLLSECIEHYQVRSLGFGLDNTIRPYYKKDIEDGVFTKKQINEYIGYFLMQFSAIDNYWGHPMYLGGTNLDGSSKIDDVSFNILKVYDTLGIYNPKIQIKINKNTPIAFKNYALEIVRHGLSSIVFCNEEIITQALMTQGYTYEQSLDSVISGCYEYKVKNKGIDIGVAYYNLLKPILYTMNNGRDENTQELFGIKTGEPSDILTFQDFYRKYLNQIEYTLNAYLDALDKQATLIADINPSLMFSATQIDCVETMTDAIDCGLENNILIVLSALGSAVDALMAIKKLVYDDKEISLVEFTKVLRVNWEGHEELRSKALNAPKYGNGHTETDFYANILLRFVKGLITTKKNSHNGQFILEVHSARAFIVHGESTGASPDGRYAGQETSKNASPAPGADKNGVTALILSATKLDTIGANCGFCLDVMLHPSSVQGEDGLIAIRATLDTYMKLGGASIQYNIFDANTLIDAQKNPEKYKNLQVRVCGWNVLWNTMDKAEQDLYILRAENLY